MPRPSLPSRQPGDQAESRILWRVLVHRRTVIAVCALGLMIAAARVALDVWNRDVSWFLDVSDRVMHGQRLYVDILEDNPPLIVWMGIPFVWLQEVSGFPAIAFYYAFVLFLVAASTWCCDHVVRRDLAPAERVVFVTFLVVSLAAPPGFELGEREHVMLLLCLPYLVLLGAPRSGLTPGARVALGVLAGLGFALKPFFLLFWLAPLAVAAVRRGVRYLLAPEHLAVASVLTGYAAGVVLFTPYIFTARTLYAGYGARVGFWSLVTQDATLLLAAASASTVLVHWPRRLRPLRDCLLATALGALGALLLQGKGFPYHYYPVSALSLLVLVLAGWSVTTRADRRRRAGGTLRAASLLVLLAAAPVLSTSLTVVMLRARAEFRWYERDMLAVLKPYRSIAAFSQVMQTGFPLALDARVRWVLPIPYLWFIPGFHPDGISSNDAMRGAPVNPAELRIRKAIVDALVADPPDLIIVDTPPAMAGVRVDYLAYFSGDPRFARLFQGYGFFEDLDGCRIFRRGSTLAAPPPEAAGGPCGPSISGH
jgi:hypothetical protein